MRSLAITDANLANQKEAVKQERRLSFDNQPYATAIVDTWPQLAYQNWHNSHSLIGSFEDLNAATTADVRNFFRTYYAPNNAVLAIVGDIDIPAAKKLIETYFGDIPRQPAPQRPDLSEPAATPKTEVVHDKLARVPAVVIGYPGPKRRSPDYYAMYMVDAILTGGTSSRFNLDLVKGKESVIQYEANLGWPFAGPTDYRDPEDYGINLLYKPNFTGKQIVDQVQGEIDRLQNEGVSPQELQRVRALVESTYIQQLQNSLSRARLLAQYEAFDHDPNYINTELDRFLAVTPEQVQAAAKKYLSPAHRVVMEILPAPRGAAGTTGGGK
jgi:predicted Zn-dependent peptidase